MKINISCKDYYFPIAVFFLLLIIEGCNSDYTSKPKGYFKINFPAKKYINFQDINFPYSFEYPVYANIVRDTSYFQNSENDPYWLNVVFPSFNGKIFISYKKIGARSTYKIKAANGYSDSLGVNTFENLVNDSYKLTYKNDVKANSIEDSVMQTPNDITGIFFRLSGNVATAKQFFLSDTTTNFLRGALYFNVTPNEDSLKPVNDFLEADMKHLINTFKWK